MSFLFQPSLKKHHPESGNVFFMLLVAIILVGLLTVAVQRGGQNAGGNTIDSETLTIRVSEAQRAASEMERGIALIMQSGRSEADLRFGHPEAHADYGLVTDEPDRQLFDRLGGGAAYPRIPEGVNNGDAWEFYGGTHLPDVGSDSAELIAVLPNVTEAFCTKVNELNGQTSSQPSDPSVCLHEGATGRFDDALQFNSSPNTVNAVTFTQTPALQACVECATDVYHFYHVLMVR